MGTNLWNLCFRAQKQLSLHRESPKVSTEKLLRILERDFFFLATDTLLNTQPAMSKRMTLSSSDVIV